MGYKEDNERKAEEHRGKLAEDMKGGMKEDRSCTDIICCLIFLAFIVAMVACSGYAIANGDPERILTPFDSDGNACGQPDQCSSSIYAMPQGEPCPKPAKAGDDTVEYTIPATDKDGNANELAGKTITLPAPRDFTDYKYKYFTLTSAKLYHAVCVKECPGTMYVAAVQKGKCGRTSNEDTTKISKTFSTAKTQEACRNLCFEDKDCTAYQLVSGKCQNWYVAVKGQKDVDNPGDECHIKEQKSMTKVEYMYNSDENGYGPSFNKGNPLYSMFPTEKQFKLCLPTKEVGVDLLNQFLEKFDESTGMVKYLVELGEVWEILVGCCVGTIFISIFYIFILKWLTKPLLYISMLLILCGFILLGGWCWLKKDDYDPDLQANNYNLCFGGAIGSWVLGFIYFCFILCCWKNISLGASIMEASSEFVTSNLRVVFLPIGAYLFCVPFVLYWIVTAVFLYSIGKPEFEDMSFFANIVWTDQTNYMWWFFLFGLCWSVAFIICVQQFMIAATVCQWYFYQGSDMAGKSASVWKSFKWGMFWHCGSIAFGSFLIALITFIRIIFEYIVHQYEKVGNKENPVYKCLKCYIRYVLWCLDKYVKFITKNAFIQIALQSTNFCSAAWTSFYLMIRHVGRFSAAAMVGWIMMMLGKGTIMGLSCYLTFLIVKEAKPEVQQPLLPAVVILLVAYLVGSLFLSIFSFASTAILHCFILSEDTGNGVNCPNSLKSFLDDNDEAAMKKGTYEKPRSDSQTGNIGKGNDMN